MEYSWEAVRKLEQKLEEWFPKTYERKYSLTGNGIFNLIILPTVIYEIKVTTTTSMLPNTKTLTTDKMKNKIIEHIHSSFKESAIASLDKGKTTIKVKEWILKIEVVKKTKMPE